MVGTRVVAIELTDTQYKNLELMSMFECSSKSVIVNRAIEVYKLVTDAQTVVLNGETINFEREN